MIRKLKKKAIQKLSNLWENIDYGLRILCGKPSPVKRFIAVLIVGGALSIAYIYMLAGSIYDMGRRSAELEHLKIDHIQQIELQRDSATHLIPSIYGQQK